jgi:hypothetical protein
MAVTADVTLVYRYSDRDTVDLNLPATPFSTVKPNFPQFGRVSFWQSTRDNTYKALLLKVDKRMTRNVQFLASYTLSKADDIGFTNVLGDRYGYFKISQPGVADRRNRLVASGIFRLPGDTQVSAIADFRSSLPFNPTSGLDLNGDGYTGDLPAGVMPLSGCRDLNVDALNAFRTGRGLTPVSQIDCPTWANVDVRMSKFFTIAGTHRLEVIAQLFNIFNRANFANPPVTLPNALGTGLNQIQPGQPFTSAAAGTFGIVNSTVAKTVGLGTNRQIQFALRLNF